MVNENTQDGLINPGTLALGLTELTVSEDEGEAKITVVRTDGSDGTVSLDYATGNDTAEAGTDYTETSGTLTFAPGEVNKVVTIPIAEDLLSEGSETFSLAVGDIQGAVLGVPRTAIVTITDNDAADLNTLAFSEAEFRVDEGDGKAKIAVIRTGGNEGTVSVDYSLRDDTAKGDDYTGSAGTLTFAPGENRKTIIVPIADDSLPEREERVSLSLSNPNGIDLGGQDSAVLAIADDDELPYNFRVETVVDDLEPWQPVAFDWAGENRILIAERQGVVRVVDSGQLLDTPFIDLSDQVNIAGQRGMLGFAVHPEFPQQPYVYLAFTSDLPGETPDAEDERPSQLIRVTADANTNYTTAVPGSEVVLLELPPGGVYHATGGIRFGNDGSLFYGHGDGNQVVRAIKNPELLQSLDSKLGKLYRIDPITGAGYADNPFYNGDPNSTRSKIYNYGLRNPFRFTLHPETGEPFIGDVGWNHWEEINKGRGQNFGWPFYEGGNGKSLKTPAYAERPNAQEFYNSEPKVTPPLYALSHAAGARSITMGDFYTGETYPDLYQGSLFFADFTEGTVDALLFDEEEVKSVTRFADGIKRIAQITEGPDSNLYFLDHDDGTLNRWVFDGETANAENSLVIQAENLNLETYQVESNPYASGGNLISLRNSAGGEGRAATTFEGASGVYDLKVGYFDENDGQARLKLQVNDAVVDNWVLNQKLGSGLADQKSLTERVIRGVQLETGDNLILQGTQNANEQARVDYLELLPADAIRLEAESLELSTYESQSNKHASGGALISVWGKHGKAGIASTEFAGPSGVYNVEIAYYDENDGNAQLEFQANNEVLDSWVLDRDFGIGWANKQSLAVRTIEGVALNQGDVLTLQGIRDFGDFGRVDYVDLIPVSV